MRVLKEYRFEYDFLNNFFLNNNYKIFEDRSVNDLIYNSKEKSIIVGKDISDKNKYNRLKELVFKLIENYSIPKNLYTDIRLDIKNDVILSNELNIKMRGLDDITKTAFITYNFFRIKDIIERQGNDFYIQYKFALINETVDQLDKHVRNSISDYFYIVIFKNIIRLYVKEVDNNVNYKNPSFSDEMLYKYLDNYFSKFMVIEYDEDIVKEFINKYYRNDFQSEDRVMTFLKDFLYLYKNIVGLEFTTYNMYNLKLNHIGLFDSKKAKDIKYKKFYKYFDKVIEDDINYQSLMFLFEILEPNEYKSVRKDIMNYISVIELLLVKGDKNISYQIQNKCIKVMEGFDYTKEEFKLIYDYCSKITHGDYRNASLKLEKLSLLEQYIFDDEYLDRDYMNKEQMVEKRMRERLFKILVTLFKYYIFKNVFVNSLKHSL